MLADGVGAQVPMLDGLLSAQSRKARSLTRPPSAAASASAAASRIRTRFNPAAALRML